MALRPGLSSFKTPRADRTTQRPLAGSSLQAAPLRGTPCPARPAARRSRRPLSLFVFPLEAAHHRRKAVCSARHNLKSLLLCPHNPQSALRIFRSGFSLSETRYMRGALNTDMRWS
ncbi:hypothetical protein NDU88_004287 [Pleurodeles waltl]|uniref:Uncharacterized protein n=1 Tax=Pleurodeles waltl TaxID=8319 RepID=A0AAV7TTN4_PLEWA|nr:hypothetical protein NDU88_004287 [Pleurodeles waltl]